MDLNERVVLTDTSGGSVELPLVNLLRILVVKLRPLQMHYLEETAEPSIAGFDQWLSDKLGMKGKNVLL